MGALLQVTEEQTSEIGMHALVPRDELVRKRKTRHQPPLLQPKDGRERAREEDTLNGSERHETLSKGRPLV